LIAIYATAVQTGPIRAPIELSVGDIVMSEDWRTLRIAKCLRIASTMLGMTTDQLQSLLLDVRDERGVLVVVWRHQHTEGQERAFLAAWEMCGESRANHIQGGA
jgi:hypothetical protein